MKEYKMLHKHLANHLPVVQKLYPVIFHVVKNGSGHLAVGVAIDVVSINSLPP